MLSLESIFEKKCDEHDSLKLLSSQWHFDKELLSKALQDIVVFFPHYSRHDASHSKQIITNIERILSDRLINLTATDMWLLLEAAYSHDLGMVITQKQIDDIDSDEFESYIKSHVNDVDSEFHLFAKDWVEEKALLPRGKSSYLFINKYKQVLAEWYRQKHANNSSKYIRNPVSEIGLNSPRNELLPKRLFNTLADICEAHGKNFSDVLDLPHTEAGVGVDDCHPRYIACLLRMGDILDIDDNRFCPVMMNISGDSIPRSSLHHFEKHQSIKHLRIDSERIKIEVECENPDVYEITYDWFKWVEKEYYLQSQYWPKIVPNKELGKLPSLSTPIVRIKKPYLILRDGLKPKFELNKNKVLNILRSSGLYNNKIDFIREVLQNAVDSTLISFWYENKKKLNIIEPFGDDFYKIANESVIFIDYSQSENVISLSICDKGMGICYDELINIISIGSSNRNTKKRKLLNEMPLWLRPSGTFGIGLQSLFMVTDKFTILTKSRFTDECYEICFYKNENKGITIKEVDKNKVDYGAKVYFDIIADKHPEKITYSMDSDSIEGLVKTFSNYDISKEDSDLSNYELVKIVEGIVLFNNFSPVKLSSEKVFFSKNEKKINTFFSKKFNIALSNLHFSLADHTFLDDNVFFKGQKVKGIGNNIAIVTCFIDFYGVDAMDFLTFDRSEILKSAVKGAQEKLIGSILEYIELKFDEIDERQRSYAAMFYFLYCGNFKEIDDKYIEYIMNAPLLSFKEESITLSFIIGKIKLGEVKKTIEGIYNRANNFVINEDEITVNRVVQNLLKIFLTKEGMFWYSSLCQETHQEIINWTSKDIIPIESDYLKYILLNDSNRFYVGNRILISCWGKYRKLAINTTAPWTRVINHLAYNEEYMILPIIIKNREIPSKDVSNDLIDWIYNKLIKKIEKEEIKILLDDLYDEILSVFKD
ncbi:TPA: HD domain-containing protein [Providencia alcalifaciens]